MSDLTRIYTIHTTLQIAFARLRAIPLGPAPAGAGRLYFTEEAQLDEANQSACIRLHLDKFTLALGRWHVTGMFAHEHSRIIARYASFIVTIAAPFFVLPDPLQSAVVKVTREGAECTFTQAQRARRAVVARLPELRQWLSAHVWDDETLRGLVEMRCCVLAETPQVMRVTVRASAALAALVDEFDRSIRAQWGGAVQDELGARLIALLRNERMSYEAIARELFVSTSTVKRRAKELQAHGLVPERKRGRK